MKFAVLSHVLPPASTGQATMLGKLLGARDPAQYVLISSAATSHDAQHAVPARYHVPRPPARFGSLRAIALVARSRRVAQILRAERCEAIVGCTGDFYDLPTACLASRLSHTRFYAYLFDDYTYQWPSPRRRALARLLEPVLLRAASGTIVPNEFLRESITRRHRVRPTIVRNACELASYEGPAFPVDPGRVVYTGAVYGAQLDALVCLADALRLLGRRDARLHLYTTASADDVAARGITGAVTVHAHRAPAGMPSIQRAADVLFLPLTFAADYHHEVIRTAAPGKMAEYLAAGRPILVHAPGDSFVSQYFRAHQCGLVVDRPDVGDLAAAVVRLFDDDALRRMLAGNAVERARADFDLAGARRDFERALGVPASAADTKPEARRL